MQRKEGAKEGGRARRRREDAEKGGRAPRREGGGMRLPGDWVWRGGLRAWRETAGVREAGSGKGKPTARAACEWL